MDSMLTTTAVVVLIWVTCTGIALAAAHGLLTTGKARRVWRKTQRGNWRWLDLHMPGRILLACAVLWLGLAAPFVQFADWGVEVVALAGVTLSIAIAAVAKWQSWLGRRLTRDFDSLRSSKFLG